jgi:DNA-binding response OmpR family regulator/tRNA A-37 threonylcarbamoyl transferase component Bud32
LVEHSVPQRFGPYTVLDRIGDGGMAEIYLAKREGYSGFEKVLALKRILPRYSQNPAFARMLIHEAKLAARLQHFNVVQVHDLGEIDRQVFIAMEYVNGRDLAALLSNAYRRKERLPVPVSLCIAVEFLTGLDYAHRLSDEDGAPLGLIHRDVSPQNVLISYEGEVKLTDFGIARVVEHESELRLPGNLHGKFGYMSPEQVNGQALDQRSDIFSAGIVLYEMLTGQRLFRGKTPRVTIDMIKKMEIVSPCATNPDVPPDVERIAMKALARDREERYQTVGALLGELSRAAEALADRASRRDLAVYMRRQFGALAAREPGSMRPRERMSGFSLTASNRVPIGEILVSSHGLEMEQLEIVLAEQRARGGRIGELLVQSGVITEEMLAMALAEQAGVHYVDGDELARAEPDATVIARYPKTEAQSKQILPLSIHASGASATLAVADPYDTRALLETRIILGVSEATLIVGPKSAIHAAIQRCYAETDETPLPVLEPVEVVTEPATAASPLTEPCVVVADADRAALEAIASRLRDEEIEVHTAGDGKTARTLIREKQPSVILLDAALPAIDGYNVLLDVRSTESDAAVFMSSSLTDAFHQSKALELGADDFFPKPLNLEVTISKIRRELQKRAGGKRAVPPPSQFNGVSGSLLEMTALDIVQSLELGRKTAQVVLQYEDGRSGEVGLVSGVVKGCVAGKAKGEEAFILLSQHGKGLFRIEYRTPTTPENITQPNSRLIIEAYRSTETSERADGSRLVDTDALIGDLDLFAPRAKVSVPPVLEPAPDPLQVDFYSRTPTPNEPPRAGAWSFDHAPPPPRPSTPGYPPARPSDDPNAKRLGRVSIQRVPTTSSPPERGPGPSTPPPSGRKR